MKTQEYDLATVISLFIGNKQFIFTAFFVHLTRQIKIDLEHCYRSSANDTIYLSTWKYYFLYNTRCKLYMGNVLAGGERDLWNVSSVRSFQYVLSFHAHVLVYEASVQKLLRLRRSRRNVTQRPMMLAAATRSLSLQALQGWVHTFWIQRRFFSGISEPSHRAFPGENRVLSLVAHLLPPLTKRPNVVLA